MAGAPAKRSFAGIENITCGFSRDKDEFFPQNNCVVEVKNHLRSCNLSRTKVTEYDTIWARAGKLNLSHEEAEKMVFCPVQRQSRPRKTVGILAMKEKRLPFTVKKQLTGKWRIQEIREMLPLFIQLFSFFNSSLFFLSKELWGINKCGKRKIKYKAQSYFA